MLDTLHHVVRHRVINVFSKIHKPEGMSEGLTHRVVEVARIDRNTVPTDTRTGIEGLETKRLGFRCPNDLPNIYPKLVTELGHLVDKPDVDVPVRVFK